MTKLLVADTSAVARSVVKQIIGMSDDMEYCGEASTFESMLTEIDKLKPDIALVDIKVLNAIALYQAYSVLKGVKIPVLLFIPPELYIEKDIVYKRDVIVCRKPDLFSLNANQLEAYAKELGGKLNELKQNFRFNLNSTPQTFNFSIPAKAESKENAGISASNATFNKYRAVFIGVSTGGPGTIQRLLSDIGEAFPVPIIITQHIDSNFDKNLIEWLDTNTKLPVILAEDSMMAENGKVYFAPADYHLVIQKDPAGRIILKLNHDDQVNFLRPSVDKMFDSAAEVLGENCIGVLLTGMGADGASGLVNIKNKGGYTITESEDSCIIYGMPKAAFEMGGSKEVLHLSKIADRLKELTGVRK